MTLDRPAPGPLPTLARPDVRRDRRPGSGRRDAPQRRPDRARRPRHPVRRAARNRQDLARADPGQGGQLHGPPGRRRLRRLPVVRLDPRGHDPRPDRDRRRDATAASTRSATCASACRIRPASSGARSTSSTRRTRSPRTPGTRSSSRSRSRPTSSSSCSPRPSRRGFPPAILSRLQRYDVRRLTVAGDRGQADPDPRRPTAGRPSRPPSTLIARLAAGGMRDAESMLDQLLSAAPERIDEAHVRDLLGLADAEVVDAFVDRLVRGDARGRRRAPRRARGARPRRPGAARPGGRRDPRASSSPGSAIRRRPDTIPRRWPPPAAGSPPSTPTGPGSAACASSSSSPCSPAASASAPRAAAVAATARPRPRRDAAPPEHARVGRTARAATATSPTAATPAGPAPPSRRAPPSARPLRPSRHRRRAAEAPPPRSRRADAATQAAAAASPAEPAAPPRPPPPSRRPPTAAAPAAAPTTGGADDARTRRLPRTRWPDDRRTAERASGRPSRSSSTCRPVAVDGAIVDPRLSRGAGASSRTTPNARQARHRGRHRAPSSATGQRALRRRQHRARRPPAADDLVAEARRIFADDLADVGEVS